MILRRGVAALLSIGCVLAQTLPADWESRDVEGKWFAYRRDCETNGDGANLRKQWAALLRDRHEVELLELVALHEGWRHAGPMLVALGSDRTFRAALWNLGAFDSHSRDNAEQALQGDAAAARRWFTTYPQAQRGKGKAVFDTLEVDPAAECSQLPPHDPMQVLGPALDPPAELVDFGDRVAAEPRVVYVHQVERALRGVLVYGDVDQQLVPKVVQLLRHRNERVRAAALMTLTQMPADRLPAESLVRLADGDGDAVLRRMATVALSYAGHPRAVFALLRIGDDAAHPGSESARKRLGDMADPGLLQVLLQKAANDPVPTVDWAETVAAMQKQTAAAKVETQSVVRSWIERAAWLRVEGDPRASSYGQGVIAELQLRLSDEVRRKMWSELRQPAARSVFSPAEQPRILAAIDELLR